MTSSNAGFSINRLAWSQVLLAGIQMTYYLFFLLRGQIERWQEMGWEGRKGDMQLVATDQNLTWLAFIGIIPQKQSEGAAQHHAHCATFGSDASVNQKPPLKYSFQLGLPTFRMCRGGVNTHVQLIGMERQMLCGSAWIWQPFAAPNPPCHHA